ncbi:hypothetical protein [Kribbella sindirgiensis]|uniref:Secreted protein n=1 Tax=Kribbella sindirgiensis TaxID=1124744 RepID=A0A4R0IAS0_9ACTN|nr:hypothetical protein [Kribbella sindirgiensis]TCC26289.1 hypothetical protein E0H50_30545 [Kribbella sindirgiensis]
MNIRRVFYSVLAGGAIAAGGLAVPAAQAVEVPVGATAVAADNWEYVGDFFWQSDCHAAGAAGTKWTKYKCVDGSAFPGDDYELWVVYK